MKTLVTVSYLSSTKMVYCVILPGGEGPAVETSNGLPECSDWAELHDPDCHHALWRQQQGQPAEVFSSFVWSVVITPDEYIYCLCVWDKQDPSSEERFHVELHFSPGVKGCGDDEENIPLGFGFRPASSEVFQQVFFNFFKTVDVQLHSQVVLSWEIVSFCLLWLFQNEDKKPNQGSLEDLSQDQPDEALPLSDPINIQKKSPMIRNRKGGSMEVNKIIDYRSLTFTMFDIGETRRWHPWSYDSSQVLSETLPTQSSKGSTSHRLFPTSSRHSPEIKPSSGLGEHLNFLYISVCVWLGK